MCLRDKSGGAACYYWMDRIQADGWGGGASKVWIKPRWWRNSATPPHGAGKDLLHTIVHPYWVPRNS